jgi:putative hemolysin
MRGGVVMRNSVKKGMASLFVVMLCILAFLAILLPQSMAEGSAADAAHNYCVQMGYLYRSSPSMNNGQGICEFQDKTWCDAQAFYAGQCGPRLYPSPISSSGSTLNPSASALCRNAGGHLENVHTPYGDVVLCVFPNGRTCDIQSLYNGMCGGDDWLRYAGSWLNGP